MAAKRISNLRTLPRANPFCTQAALPNGRMRSFASDFPIGSPCRFGAELRGSAVHRNGISTACDTGSGWAAGLSRLLRRGTTVLRRNWCSPLFVLRTMRLHKQQRANGPTRRASLTSRTALSWRGRLSATRLSDSSFHSSSHFSTKKTLRAIPARHFQGLQACNREAVVRRHAKPL
jgi:hypothetical protein